MRAKRPGFLKQGSTCHHNWRSALHAREFTKNPRRHRQNAGAGEEDGYDAGAGIGRLGRSSRGIGGDSEKKRGPGLRRHPPLPIDKIANEPEKSSKNTSCGLQIHRHRRVFFQKQFVTQDWLELLEKIQRRPQRKFAGSGISIGIHNTATRW